MRKFFAALLLLVGVVAHAQSLANSDQMARAYPLCQEAIRGKLKDPDSAKFSPPGGGMTHQGRWFFPVMVRARNSFGGMAAPVVFSCYLDLGLTGVVELKY